LSLVKEVLKTSGRTCQFQTRCWNLFDAAFSSSLTSAFVPPILLLLRDLPLTARPPWGLSTPLGRKDTKQLEASVVDPGLTLQFAHNVVRTLRDALVDLGDPARKGR
jgi:hypothetical protein